MKQSPQQGDNRTSFAASGRLGEQMLEATREFLPSSPGTAQAIAEVRVEYARAGETLGETPPPLGVIDKAKAAVSAVTGGQPTLLMDKLSERLAFEHAGARLYEALLSKHEAYGSFAGGPEPQDILHILQEEHEHADRLQQAIKALGGDPTTVSPSANLAMNISAGLPQVLSDPRTNLLQSLEAILVAELADNDCWSALETLARQAGHEDLAAECQEAIAHEREHLQNVRRWIAAGQGRDPQAVEGAPPPGADDEFTFAADSPVDREGYAVSDEEAAERGPAGERGASTRPRGAAGRRKTSGRNK
jgi:rubrerythrin